MATAQLTPFPGQNARLAAASAANGVSTQQPDAPSPPIEQVTSTATRPKDPGNDNGPGFTPGGLKQRFEDYEDYKAGIDEKTGALKPVKFEQAPLPQTQQTSPMEAWGSASMMLAMIGGLLTRQHLTTAMNAGGAAMKAFHDNDLANAKLAFDQWKASNDMALKMAQFENEVNKTIWDHADKSVKEKLAETNAYGAALKNQQLVALSQQRNDTAIRHLNLDQKKYTESLEMNAGKVTEGANYMLALKDPQFQASMKGKSPQERAVMQADLLSKVAPDLAQAQGFLSDDDLRFMADQRLSGDKSATQGLGYGKAATANKLRFQHILHEEAAKRNISGADLGSIDAEYMGLTAGERTVGTQGARIGLGVAEMEQFAPLVEQASKALPRSNYRTMNSWIQAMQQETGNPQLRDLAIKLQAFKNAYAQVIARGGVPTDSDKHKADELWSTSDPDTVVRVALEASQQEGAAAQRAPGIVRQELRSTFKGGGGDRGPAPAHIGSKAIWPEGDHWVYADGTRVK